MTLDLLVAQGHPRALPVGEQAGEGVPGAPRRAPPAPAGVKVALEEAGAGACKAGKAWNQILPQREHGPGTPSLQLGETRVRLVTSRTAREHVWCSKPPGLWKSHPRKHPARGPGRRKPHGWASHPGPLLLCPDVWRWVWGHSHSVLPLRARGGRASTALAQVLPAGGHETKGPEPGSGDCRVGPTQKGGQGAGLVQACSSPKRGSE